MKATSTQLKSFLRSCKNAYIPMDLGNGEMLVKIIKSDLSEQLSKPEYEDSFWEYEMVQAPHGIDMKIYTVDKSRFVEDNENIFYDSSSQEETNEQPVYTSDTQANSFFHE